MVKTAFHEASLNKKQYGALGRFMDKLEQRYGQSNWRGVFRDFDR